MPEVLSFRSPAKPRKPKRRILAATTLRTLTPPPNGSRRLLRRHDTGPIAPRDGERCAHLDRVLSRQVWPAEAAHACFPTVSLADARELAREAQLKVAKDGDPLVEKRTARDVLTFGQLADRYLEDHAKPNKRSWEEY
jgi:hypothetical protein